MNLDLKEEKTESIEKKSFKEKIKAFWAKEKNRRIVIIVVIGLIAIALALGAFFIFRPEKASNLALDVNKEQASATLYPSILDGTMVSQEDANRHPLGVMVENHIDSRPQSGLASASIVYEAIAEGGITRFLAIYSPRGSEKVGPVRSARTYYVDWIKELSGFYAHVGGNYDALEKIKKEGILDLDQFANPSAYWRDKTRKVSSEHTMYTSTTKLYGIAADKKYSTANNFAQFKFKSEQPVTTGTTTPTSTAPISEAYPLINSIAINFGNANYNVGYTYDPATTSYKRELAGKPHLDAETNAQLAAKNVIVMVVKRAPTVTKINEQGWTMQTVGSGDANAFIGGVSIPATWKKDNESARTKFYNKATNAEIEFNPGTTWIEVISPDLSFSAK